MTDRDDIDMLAAEYVLGTLDNAERSAVAVRRLREPALDAAISGWETRLSPLNSYAAEIDPPADLLEKIQTRIDNRPNFARREPAAGGEIVALRSRLVRWRIATAATSLIAACLAGAVVYQGALKPAVPQAFVAVFNQGDQRPAFLLSVNLATRELTIRPIATSAPSGKSYELWIVSERFGPNPRSLGLLDDPGALTRKALPDLPRALLTQATFGISLEPKGGSPIGRPTGPALHGRLIPAVE